MCFLLEQITFCVPMVVLEVEYFRSDRTEEEKEREQLNLPVSDHQHLYCYRLER